MVIPPTAVSAFCRRSPPFHCESVVSGEQQNVGRSCRGRVARAGLLGLTEGGSRGEGGGKPAAEGGSPSPSIWRKTPPLPTQTGNLICAGWPTDRPRRRPPQTACWWRSHHDCRLVAHLRENRKVPPNCPTPVPVCPSVSPPIPPCFRVIFIFCQVSPGLLYSISAFE